MTAVMALREGDNLNAWPVLFGAPRVIEGDGVTHLSYPVRKS
jgi:hypothetical protein